MRIFKRLLAPLLLTALIVVTSVFLYQQILSAEQEECWERLSNAAQSVNQEVSMKFEDEIIKLHMLGALMLSQDTTSLGELTVLDDCRTTTLFQRVEMLFPTHVLSADGTTYDLPEEYHFDTLLAKGEHISHRLTDPRTGHESLYYLLPMKTSEAEMVILVGVIDATMLDEVFHPTIYDGQANYCLVDSSDGNFLLDSWHDTLGNAYDMEERTRLPSYEAVDLKADIQNQRTNVIAFRSQTTGEGLYMYYTPANIFDWQLMIFAQEDVIFADLLFYQRILMLAVVAEVLMLLVFFSWNIHTMRQLEKSNMEIAKQQKQLTRLSYEDLLTSLFNRNKFIEVSDLYQRTQLHEVGVAYVDLNGLKKLNDTYSHAVGDLYIRNAAGALSTAFPGNCYRIGGDEFVVIAPQMSQAQFRQQLSVLEKRMAQKSISFSLGSSWQPLCADLQALLKEAEEKMYQEKRKYYETHSRHGVKK